MFDQAAEGAAAEHSDKTEQQGHFRLQEARNPLSHREAVLSEHIPQFHCDKHREAPVFSEEVQSGWKAFHRVLVWSDFAGGVQLQGSGGCGRFVAAHEQGEPEIWYKKSDIW